MVYMGLLVDILYSIFYFLFSLVLIFSFHVVITDSLEIIAKAKTELNLYSFISILKPNIYLSLPTAFFLHLSYINNYNNREYLFIMITALTGLLLLFTRVGSKIEDEPYKERIISFAYSFIMTAAFFLLLALFLSFNEPSVRPISLLDSITLIIFYELFIIFITLLGELILNYLSIHPIYRRMLSIRGPREDRSTRTGEQTET